MKKYQTVLILIIVGIVLYFWFNPPKLRYSNEKEQQYYKTIDSLTNEIKKDKQQIASLDSVKSTLFDQITQNKKDLAKTAKQAEQYRKKYEEEINIIDNMSDDDIISTFTTAFK